MLVLADTNILLRAAKPDHSEHAPTLAALARLRGGGYEPVIVPQCCYEYYVVATRPVERNGLGLDPAEAEADLATCLRLFRLLKDERAVFDAWRNVVAGYLVRGKAAHDARLIAAMRRQQVTHLLTFNSADFSRYAGEITIVDPRRAATFEGD